jgi:hypothetical protein
MIENSPQTYFLKPSQPIYGEPKLDPVLVGINNSKGIETTLILDTNVLIAMEKVVQNGNNHSLLKTHGLYNLISLVERCPPKSICLSPGNAFNEMPPSLADQARRNYELFCQAHLPNFVDTPNCIYSEYIAKANDYGYFDLDFKAQATLAIPFCALVYLNIVDRMISGTPIQKFGKYLQCLSEDLDVLSEKEIEIAKYCFAEPPSECVELIGIRRVLRRNFMKTNEDKAPRNSKEVLAVAFNGACDLHLINSANVIDSFGIDGIQQDCWIATRDKKLAEFSKVAHYVNIDGEPGKIAAATFLPDQRKDIYWAQAAAKHYSLSLARAQHHRERGFDLAALVANANKAAVKSRVVFGCV